MQSEPPKEFPIVQMKGIVKRFPGVLANDHIDFDLYAGEIHTLLGENGAGKTTLMNILYGLYQADKGDILVKGKRVNFTSAQDASKNGLEMVHQHFQLVKPFTVAQNIILGQKSSRGPLIENKKTVHQRIEKISTQFGLDVNPEAEIWQLSVGEQQRVEILKALYRGADILILDEPTAVLTPQESDDLLEIVKELAAQGRGIVFISHKLNEVLAISDRITVLRDGGVVGTAHPKDENTTRNDLAKMMVGRHVLLRVEKKPKEVGEPRLIVKDLRIRDDRGLDAIRDVNLEVRSGEILGIAGVAGNGQRQLEEAIRGLRPVETGQIIINGEEATGRTPAKVIGLDVGHIPSDRYGRGILGDMTIAENLVLERFWKPPFTRRSVLNYRAIHEAANKLISDYDVRTPSAFSKAAILSGGNAQKMVLARELSMNPKFLLAAQPTRGLDVSAIEYVHRTLIEQRDQDIAILLISTELEEIFALSDRIAVLYEGQILGIYPGDKKFRDEVGMLMAGVKPDQTA